MIPSLPGFVVGGPPGAKGGARPTGRPMGMPRVTVGTVAVLGVAGAAMWAAKRRSTRVTPFIMGGTWCLTPLAMWAFSWWFTALIGALATFLVWLTQRQVKDAMVDKRVQERRAQQWAWRTAVVPAAGTLYLELVMWMHATGLDVVNLQMVAGYIVGCVSLWVFLFTADRVGFKRLREQVERAWAFRTLGTILEGSKLVSRRNNVHGEDLTIDVRGTGKLSPELVGNAAVKAEIAARHEIPIERVQILPAAHPGQVRARISHSNPWAGEIIHPLSPTYTIGNPGDRSILQPVIIGIDPTEHDLKKRIITYALYDTGGARHLLLVAGTGGGKMLALDTPLPTPSGWTTMGEVKDGDLIFDETGAPATVVKAHPITHGKPTYEVEFDDGSVIVACGEHLWSTSTRAQRRATSPERIGSRGTTYYSAEQTAHLSTVVDGVLAEPDRQVSMGEIRSLVEPTISLIVSASILREIGSDGKIVITVPYRDGTRPRTVPSYSLHQFVKVLQARLTKVRMSERFVPRDGTSVVSTAQIRATLRTTIGHANHSIVVTKALQYPEASLPIDPYLFGCWLGDGSSATGHITSVDREILDAFDAAGHPTKLHQGTRGIGYGLGGGFTAGLRAAGMTLTPGCKHIPEVYLHASIEQRRALLAGLLDTDGHCNTRGQVEFAVTHKPLADGFLELALGLGHKATMTSRTVSATNGTPGKTSTAYMVKFMPGEESPFRLPRKVERHRAPVARSAAGRRYIVDVRPVESVPMRCLTVDSPSRLYLAGRTCIPTHNTTLVNSIVEHVTDCSDAEVIMCDVTKGTAANAWRWACLRVHVGPAALPAVVSELEAAVSLINARSEARRQGRVKSASHAPTAKEPARVIILDEADQVLVEAKGQLKTRAQAAVKYILSKGRELGVVIIVMAQRGTLDYLGKGDVKANTGARIVLGVTQTSEMHWALPGWEARGIPDMSTYGEGSDGVFVLALPGRGHRTGRAPAMYDLELLEAISMDRVLPQHVDELVRMFYELADDGETVPVLAGGRWAKALASGELPPMPAIERAPEPGDVLARVTLGRPNEPSAPTPGDPAPVDASWWEGADGSEAPLTAGAAEEMLTAASRAATETADAAREARDRGAVPLGELIAYRTPGRIAVPQDVADYAVRLGEASGGDGFSRRDLAYGMPSVLGRVPSQRWLQEVTGALVRDGLLVPMGKGPSTRYRAARQPAGVAVQ